jgi:hypothetical protein
MEGRAPSCPLNFRRTRNPSQAIASTTSLTFYFLPGQLKLTSDKSRVFRHHFFRPIRDCLMADPKEPKKETVRINLPPGPGSQPSGTGTTAPDTARINLPARPPVTDTPSRSSNVPAPVPPASPGAAAAPRPPLVQTPLPPPPAKRVSPPPFFPKKPAPPSFGSPAVGSALPPSSPPLMPKSPTPVAPAAAGVGPFVSEAAAPSPGPKKETARIMVLPDPPAKTAPAVQMKKTQPLTTMPEAAPQSAPLTVATTKTDPFVDSIPMPLCWALLGVSAVILIVQIWNYFG